MLEIHPIPKLPFNLFSQKREIYITYGPVPFFFVFFLFIVYYCSLYTGVVEKFLIIPLKTLDPIYI